MSTLSRPAAEARAVAPGKFTRRFDQLDRGALAIAGGKGSNLAELTRAGFPVPPGFVVLVSAYEAALAASEMGPRLSAALEDLNVDDTDALQAAAKTAKEIVSKLEIPEEIAREITSAYQRLGGKDGEPLVAARSSATAEDAPSASFAGMFESFLQVRGVESLLGRIRDCWASSYSPRVLFYRAKQSMPTEMPVAVVVQQMIESERSGIIFTANPATHDTSSIVIEATWGLGEAIVQGQVTPDRYVLDKKTLGVREMKIAATRPVGDETARQRMAGPERVLSDTDLTTLAELAIRAESHFGAPQDLEFAIDSTGTYLTQTRPITTLSGVTDRPQTDVDGGRSGVAHPAAAQILVRGMGASPGTATGLVRVLTDVASGKEMKQGEVLVAHMTSPDWVPLMRRAVAIVTDAGGMTSHAAIVSRELGVPCVVGTRDATRVLRPSLRVTVDGSAGTITEAGSAAREPSPHPAKAEARPAAGRVVTATRLYVNLADPSQAESVAAQDVDGVGLLRAEFMLLEALDGAHPKQLLAEGKRDEIVRKLTEPLARIAAAFHPRPVIYRAMDFRSNEFRVLRGGETHEPVEANPMIGYRGCYRYVEEPELFGVELAALQEVRKRHDNVHLMIPFVRTEWELRRCLEVVNRSPLGESRGLQRWVMAEVPSVIWRMKDYAALGITAVSIGSNDLTQLVLGVDRDNERLASLYDERDAAVLAAIREIVVRAHEAGMTVSICGQAPSVHPEYADFLVQQGIDSISVVPDAIERTRVNIARAEQRVLLERRRLA
ncbi:MAG TPA: phosphoenolpyruvate synthase [Gemmatimonadaceae bacterium]|nr:phosphoenolpyruvate synthase [Gemmatimonadaceae bacterium]